MVGMNLETGTSTIPKFNHRNNCDILSRPAAYFLNDISKFERTSNNDCF